MKTSCPDLRQRLCEIDASPVEIDWVSYGTESWVVDSNLPHGPYYSGEVCFDETPVRMYSHRLEVPKEMRQRGVATRLVSALLRTAYNRGILDFVCSVESQHTVKIFSSLVEDTGITFSDVDPVTKKETGLAMSVPQAIMSLERLEPLEDDPEQRRLGFTMHVDVSRLHDRTMLDILETNSPFTKNAA
ncbi:MAG: hypothetical protein WBP26_01800 [Candidatus Saccharimonadales bacterium]